MANIDLRKKIIPASDPRHSKHKSYLRAQKKKLQRHWQVSLKYSAVLALVGTLLVVTTVVADVSKNAEETYEFQAANIAARSRSFDRFGMLPVESQDPKLEEVEQFLAEKNSPLVQYAGEISRMENWKLILGIAHAESNLCKKTDKNNCWGIGPGGPWTYNDISESLHYANYLIEKYESLGMSRPETMVHTYVGYYNPNWITAINDVFYELEARGL